MGSSLSSSLQDFWSREHKKILVAAGVASVGLFVSYRIGVSWCEKRAVTTDEELQECADHFLNLLAAGGRYEAEKRGDDQSEQRFVAAGKDFLRRSLSPWKAMFGFLADDKGRWDVTSNVLLVPNKSQYLSRDPRDLHLIAKHLLMTSDDAAAKDDAAKLLMGHLVDSDHDGQATFRDFWLFALTLIAEDHMAPEDRRRLMFRVIDDNGSNTLSFQELWDWIIISRRNGGLKIDNPNVTERGLAQAFMVEYGVEDTENGVVTEEQFLEQDFFDFGWLFDLMMRRRRHYLKELPSVEA